MITALICLIYILAWAIVGISVTIVVIRILNYDDSCTGDDYYEHGESVVYVVMSIFWPFTIGMAILLLMVMYWDKMQYDKSIKIMSEKLDKKISKFFRGH